MQNEATLVTDTFLVDESSAWRNYKATEYLNTLKRAVAGEFTPQEALDSFATELANEVGWEMKYPA